MLARPLAPARHEHLHPPLFSDTGCVCVCAPFRANPHKQDQARWLQKRKQQNDERRAAGEDALPDEESAFDKKVRYSCSCIEMRMLFVVVGDGGGGTLKTSPAPPSHLSFSIHSRAVRFSVGSTESHGGAAHLEPDIGVLLSD